jgi:hypothetical protein
MAVELKDPAMKSNKILIGDRHSRTITSDKVVKNEVEKTQSHEGERVCEVGRAHLKKQCGRLLRRDVRWCADYEKKDCTAHLGKADFETCEGDSGGAVYYEHVAWGLVTGGPINIGKFCGNPTYFTQIQYVLSDLKVSGHTLRLVANP